MQGCRNICFEKLRVFQICFRTLLLAKFPQLKKNAFVLAVILMFVSGPKMEGRKETAEKVAENRINAVASAASSEP